MLSVSGFQEFMDCTVYICTSLNNKKRKTSFPFAFCSLIRTFFVNEETTFARKRKEKQVFLLLFAHLFVPLQQISKKYDERTYLYQF